MNIGGHPIGRGNPVFIIAEIGINHNGSIKTALKLIDAAVDAGCTAVKFQKRTPEFCVPASMRQVMRDTPWGRMSYMDYRIRVEFQDDEYDAIDRYCKDKEILWFASCWDAMSVDFMHAYRPPAYKIASAAAKDERLLRRHARLDVPIILSTGMCGIRDVDKAVNILGDVALLHCVSAYPCKPKDLNLRAINALQQRYGLKVGYSGHETGLQTTLAAVAMGACIIERHITLDRSMWGTDQSASLEPHGLKRLVRDIRVIESAMGDGNKRIMSCEESSIARLQN